MVAGSRSRGDAGVGPHGGAAGSAGIVGLTTARALLQRNPARRVTIIEKENEPAHHQTGRNSGVIHSGIYCKPGSEKATMVAGGRGDLLRFLDEHAIDYDMCGKLVVAVDADELPRLDALEARAAENAIPTERLDQVGLHHYEPHIVGVAALRVPSAGIVDYARVCDALITEVVAAGACHQARRTGVTERCDSRFDHD